MERTSSSTRSPKSVPYTFHTVAESDVTSKLREQLGVLMAEGLDDGPAYLHRAWRTIPPILRIVAQGQDAQVVGHTSIFLVETEPTVSLYGIGDVVVHADHRRRGIARELCARAVARCWEQGAAVVLTKTKPLRDVFAELGLKPVTECDFFYQQEDLLVRHQDWMAAKRIRSTRPIQLLQGDF